MSDTCDQTERSSNVTSSEQMVGMVDSMSGNESNVGVPVQLLANDSHDSALQYHQQAIELNGVRHVIVSEAQDPETGEVLIVLQGENGDHIAIQPEALSSMMSAAEGGGIQMTMEGQSLQVGIEGGGGIQMGVVTTADTNVTNVESNAESAVEGSSIQVGIVSQSDESIAITSDTNCLSSANSVSSVEQTTTHSSDASANIIQSLIANIPSRLQSSTAPTNVVQSVDTPRVTAQEEQTHTTVTSVEAKDNTTIGTLDSSVVKATEEGKTENIIDNTTESGERKSESVNETNETKSDDTQSKDETKSDDQTSQSESKQNGLSTPSVQTSDTLTNANSSDAKLEEESKAEKVSTNETKQTDVPISEANATPEGFSNTAVIQVQDSSDGGSLETLMANAMLSENENYVIMAATEDGQMTALPSELNLSDVISAGSAAGQTFFIETPEGQLVACTASASGEDGAIQIIPTSSEIPVSLNSTQSSALEGQILQAISGNQNVAISFASNSGCLEFTPVATTQAPLNTNKSAARNRGGRTQRGKTVSPVSTVGQTILLTTDGLTVDNSAANTAARSRRANTTNRGSRVTPSNAFVVNSGNAVTSVQKQSTASVTKSANLDSSRTSLSSSFMDTSSPGPSQLAASRRTYSKKSNIVWITPEASLPTELSTASTTNSTNTTNKISTSSAVTSKVTSVDSQTPKVSSPTKSSSLPSKPIVTLSSGKAIVSKSETSHNRRVQFKEQIEGEKTEKTIKPLEQNITPVSTRRSLRSSGSSVTNIAVKSSESNDVQTPANVSSISSSKPTKSASVDPQIPERVSSPTKSSSLPSKPIETMSHVKANVSKSETSNSLGTESAKTETKEVPLNDIEITDNKSRTVKKKSQIETKEQIGGDKTAKTIEQSISPTVRSLRSSSSSSDQKNDIDITVKSSENIETPQTESVADKAVDKTPQRMSTRKRKDTPKPETEFQSFIKAKSIKKSKDNETVIKENNVDSKPEEATETLVITSSADQKNDTDSVVKPSENVETLQTESVADNKTPQRMSTRKRKDTPKPESELTKTKPLKKTKDIETVIKENNVDSKPEEVIETLMNTSSADQKSDIDIAVKSSENIETLQTESVSDKPVDKTPQRMSTRKRKDSPKPESEIIKTKPIKKSRDNGTVIKENNLDSKAEEATETLVNSSSADLKNDIDVAVKPSENNETLETESVADKPDKTPQRMSTRKRKDIQKAESEPIKTKTIKKIIKEKPSKDNKVIISRENDSQEKEEETRRKTLSSLSDLRSPTDCYEYITDECNFYIRHQSTSLTKFTPKQESGSYICPKCGYRTTRINNLVLHHKDLCVYIKNAAIQHWQTELQKLTKPSVNANDIA